ncbi:MAG: M23 family metallopeptidase [Eggerthellaceae bacterium]|nr:M23 family metallopeptidase [Eggerthellaceae bacterium]
MAKHAKQPIKPEKHTGKRIGKGIAIALALLVALAAAGSAIYFWALPNVARIQAAQQKSSSTQATETSSTAATSNANASGSSTESQAEATTPATYQVAAYDDIPIYCPIRTADLTAVIFHQASYAYALQMYTELPKADGETAYNEHYLRVNHAQNSGTWVDADTVHAWRTSASTNIDTSIDAGALAGTPVYAPVTGTVVLVTEYQLFEQLTDIEIHIQPEGHPELDVVVIHTTDPLVKAGDKVVAGTTQISSVRDISSISGVQLSEYTSEDDPGNHAHVQINDANYEGYRETKLQGAITVE